MAGWGHGEGGRRPYSTPVMAAVSNIVDRRKERGMEGERERGRRDGRGEGSEGRRVGK